MTEHLTDVNQLPSKDEFNAALVMIAKRRFTEANRCFSDGVCECDSCVAGQTLVEEIQRLETALRGISTCSTREACRGAALRALGVAPCDHDPMSHGSTLECDSRGALICKHCDTFDRSYARAAQPPGAGQ